MTTGTFKIRVTGRSVDERRRRAAAIIATFRRDSFLNFVYFTDYENRDPRPSRDATERARQQTELRRQVPRRPHGQRLHGDPVRHRRHDQRAAAHQRREPADLRHADVRPHKDQDGTPRDEDRHVEVAGGGTGHVPTRRRGCGDSPTINTPTEQVHDQGQAARAAREQRPARGGRRRTAASHYTGKTFIRLQQHRDGRHQPATASRPDQRRVADQRRALRRERRLLHRASIPTAANYDEPTRCGNVYVSGTYSKSLTIAAANDIIIKPTRERRRPNDAQHRASRHDDATLGLIANNFVRVAHRVDRGLQGNAHAEPIAQQRHDRGRDPVAPALVHRRQLRLRHGSARSPSTARSCRSTAARSAPAPAARSPPATPRTTGTTTASATAPRRTSSTPVDAAWDVVRSHEQVPAR